MKKLLALIAILGFAGLAHAAKALRIEFNDGTAALYALSTQPALTFAGPDFTIKAADAETSYPRADVRNFTFVQEESGITNLTGITKFEYLDNVFSCPGHQIEVYNMSGRLVANGMESVSLRGLGDGVYIVRANNQSIKVVK